MISVYINSVVKTNNKLAFGPIATGTKQTGWKFEHAKLITIYIVQREHVFLYFLKRMFQNY